MYMNDIFDIKDTLLWSPIWTTESSLFLVLLCLLFVLFYFLQKHQNHKSSQVYTSEEQQLPEINFKEQIDILEQLEWEDFLRQSLCFCASYFGNEKGYRDFEKLTLAEIANIDILDKKDYNFFQDLYNLYYAWKKVSPEKRLEIISYLRTKLA